MAQNLESLLGSLGLLLVCTQVIILGLVVLTRALTTIGLLKKGQKSNPLGSFLRSFS